MFLDVGDNIGCVVQVASQLAIVREKCCCSTLAAVRSNQRTVLVAIFENDVQASVIRLEFTVWMDKTSHAT